MTLEKVRYTAKAHLDGTSGHPLLHRSGGTDDASDSGSTVRLGPFGTQLSAVREAHADWNRDRVANG
jgi:hypothetical protein